MFDTVIGIVIGLLFIYLLLSLLASVIHEIIASFLSLRGRFLVLTISKFIDDENNNLSKGFLDHPFFRKICPPSGRSWFKKLKLPSYLDKKDFSKIFLGSLLNHNSDDGFRVEQISFEKIKAKVEALHEGETKQVLLLLVNDAERTEDKLQKFQDNLEEGYESLMNRASGWYKRRTQLLLFVIGLIITVAFNADTIRITKQLSSNSEMRGQLVAMAERFQNQADTAGLRPYYKMSIKKSMNPDFVAKLKKQSGSDSTQALKFYSNLLQLQKLMQNNLSPVESMLGLSSIAKLKIPAGKQGFWAITGWVVLKILGWLLTALAISLGAPFWFDLLNKVMKMRASGKVPEKG